MASSISYSPLTFLSDICVTFSNIGIQNKLSRRTWNDVLVSNTERKTWNTSILERKKMAMKIWTVSSTDLSMHKTDVETYFSKRIDDFSISLATLYVLRRRLFMKIMKFERKLFYTRGRQMMWLSMLKICESQGLQNFSNIAWNRASVLKIFQKENVIFCILDTVLRNKYYTSFKKPFSIH